MAGLPGHGVMAKAARKKKAAARKPAIDRKSTAGAGRLIAVEGVSGRGIVRAATRLAASRRQRAGISSWDASGIFGELESAGVDVERPSARTLMPAVVPLPIASVAIRACPKLPPTIEERIADNRAQTFADSVMYREALATAAEARGWSVHWYDRERVFRDAAAVLGREDINAFLYAMGRPIGPPWQAKHKLAAAAALAATGHPAPGPMCNREHR